MKLTDQELEGLKSLWNIAQSSARMTMTMQTKKSINEAWIEKCKDICQSRGLDITKVTFDLNKGEINIAA